MILPDANLLLYAVNSDSPDHAEAHQWWRDLVQSDVPVGLYTGVVFAFIRLSTNRRVFLKPLRVEEAFAYVENWLCFPSVQLVEVELEDLAVARDLLQAAGTGGNLVSDAQIAAAARRLKGTVHSADVDFARFKGVKWVNPLS
ncbi:MAG TPA: TA system VapC family ribonuclease toxin [Opitutales bacterium]|nr:TA system VapC family ribonuclease toxin [Opitutales bacterium]